MYVCFLEGLYDLHTHNLLEPMGPSTIINIY